MLEDHQGLILGLSLACPIYELPYMTRNRHGCNVVCCQNHAVLHGVNGAFSNLLPGRVHEML